MSTDNPGVRVQTILFALILFQALLLIIMFAGNPAGVPAYLGFTSGQTGSAWSWLLAAVITIAYVWSACSISDVKTYLFKLDHLKALAIVAAIMAGIVEEVVFRKLVMDYLSDLSFGVGIQVVASALAFGLIHAIWGVKSIAAGLNAMLSTAVLGAGLAIVYILADRSLAPCIVAHIIISALIEPGMMVAAVSDRLGIWREKLPR